MKKTDSTKPPAAKYLPLTSHKNSEHDNSTPMETANASSNKQERTITPASSKNHTRRKKAKGMPQENDCNTSTDTVTILKAIDSLGKRVDDCMEEVSKKMSQHSPMLAAIAKSVQLNSMELDECEMKI